jgi:PAS domain S-box-containing protein
MAGLIRDHDWNKNPLGPPHSWPASLRTAVDFCLACAVPSAVFWGDDLRMLPNDAYAQLMHGDEEHAVGTPFAQFWGEARAETEAVIRKVMSHGQAIEMSDMRATLTRGGVTRATYLHVSYGPIHGESGNVAGVFAVAIDVTGKVESEQCIANEREKMERTFNNRTDELSRSRAFLDSLIENLPNMVFVKDARELRFVRLNRAGEELLGVPREAFFGKNDFDFFPTEQAEKFVANDRAVLAGREIVNIAEEKIQTRHQGERILHTRKIPVFGADGTPEYLLGISDDITEKRAAEQEHLRLRLEEAALVERESASRRVALLADASVALAASLDFRETLQRLATLMVRDLATWCTVTVRNEAGAFVRVAAAHRDPKKAPLIAEVLEKYQASGVQGAALNKLMMSEHSQFNPAVTDQALMKLAHDERHFTLMRELGTTSSLVAPIRGREQVHGKIAFMRGEGTDPFTEDDLRTAEELGRRAGIAIDNAVLYLEAQKAVAARDAFLSIASHELKTPLTSLTIQTQLRQRQLGRGQTFTTAALLKMAEGDARQLDRLTRLIDDMLDISRIASGKLTINPEQVNLAQLVREVAERGADQAARAGSSFTVSGNAEVVGLWDRFRIEQVVTNLFTNAVKYGGGKPVQAVVRASNGAAFLEVIDHGIGIAQADQERIFRQFERAVGPSEVSGLGLGLYIVKQILDLHGGEILVESEPGHGSRFVVKLPL